MSNSSPTIKLSQILENVKFIDEFAKRIPFEKILDSSDDRNIPDGKKTKDDTIDEEYMAAVESGDTETAQRMVDEAAQAAGYNTSKLYHITKSQQFIRWFGDWQNKPDILLQQNLKTDFCRRTESLLLGAMSTT